MGCLGVKVYPFGTRRRWLSPSSHLRLWLFRLSLEIEGMELSEALSNPFATDKDLLIRMSNVRRVAALLAHGHDASKASIRKALHDRSQGPAPRLRRVGHGLYTGG